MTFTTTGRACEATADRQRACRSCRCAGHASGPTSIDVGKLYRDTGCFTYDPGFTSTANCVVADHLHRRRRGRPALSRLSDRAARRAVELPRGLLPAAPRRAADQGSSSRRSAHTITHHTMLHEQMTRFFTGFRRDAHPMAVMVGVVGALSAFYHDSHRHQRSEAAHDRQPPHDRQDADDRGHGLQVFDRPALHLSAQRSRLTRELPADVLRRARASRIIGQSGAGAARSTASSSCTPTTSRTPRPRRCASPARRAPTRSPASPPASPACGAPRTAAPTRRR